MEGLKKQTPVSPQALKDIIQTCDPLFSAEGGEGATDRQNIMNYEYIDGVIALEEFYQDNLSKGLTIEQIEDKLDAQSE